MRKTPDSGTGESDQTLRETSSSYRNDRRTVFGTLLEKKWF
jgi:hypothetical protein